jgi:hypothetical protein
MRCSRSDDRHDPLQGLAPGPDPELHVVYEGAELPFGIRSLGPWVELARRPRIHDNRSMVDIITLFKKSASLHADADQREGRQGESISHDSP